MKVISIECQDCKHLNQIPGSDIDLLALPGSSYRACWCCGGTLDFSRARVETYQGVISDEPV